MNAEPNTSPAAAATRIVVMALVVLQICGCTRLGYYAQSIRGQLDLLSRREPIQRLLADPATDEALRARLEKVVEIRDFASAQLFLPDNDSYRSYADLERDYAIWTVVAAPEFSIQPHVWCFPFVGCVSYRGYFSEAPAREFAATLARRGDDVYVAGVAAYSTLGNFADPVLNTMMRGDDTYLAGLLFHELAHQVLYVRDDTDFNEAFATVVEEEGVRRWLAARGDDASWQRWQQRRARQEQFTALVASARERLRKLYDSDAGDAGKRRGKQAELNRLREEYESLRAQWEDGGNYDHWFAGPLNNAQLASVATYRRWVPALRQLLAQSGGDLQRFYARSGELGELEASERDRVLSGLAQHIARASGGLAQCVEPAPGAAEHGRQCRAQ